MASIGHLAQLREGIGAWNAWRHEQPSTTPDLRRVNLTKADLSGAIFFGTNLDGAILFGADLSKASLHMAILFGANLEGANLTSANLEKADLNKATLDQANLSGAILFGANLSGAKLRQANLEGANLSGANLFGVNLSGANLVGANLSKANLHEAILSGAILEDANLSGANLERADLNKATFRRSSLHTASLQSTVLIGTNFENADLTGCRVYGVSAWDVKLGGAKQRNLVITTVDQPKITVDNLEVAQFIYLLLHNKKIRDVIDTITSKVVLILGRFAPERKAVLDALREELRKRDYLPVLFDFDKPASKDLTGTVSTLAHMARFIIADLTDPSCIPHELAMVIPTTVVPVQPVLLKGMREYAMFIDLKKRHQWVLEPYSYSTQDHLIAELSERVIGPAEAKVRELRG